MGAFFVYIVKSAVCLAVFYLFYRLLLSRETFHRFNRIALLGILILSCAIPFAEVTMKEPMEVSQQLLTWEELLLMADLNRTATVEAAPVSAITWREVLLMVYLLGIVFFFLRNVWSLTRMLRLIKGSTLVRQENGITLITHQKKIAPFSWMKFVMISEKDLKENGEEILTHEYAHIRKRHSIDLLIADICIFFQWFNPASWLLKQELQNIHEFEADESVIAQGIDAKKYQLLLIKKAVGTRLYSMANSFNHSSLKKRITMMLKERTNRWARLKLLFVVPVMGGALYAFAQPEVKEDLGLNTVREVLQSKTREDQDIFKFVDDEMEAYYNRSPKNAELKYKIRERQTHIVKVDANGQLHVHSSFNNIIVSLANSEGQIISWSSAGKMGFRGSKKNTPYAAQMAAQDCAKVAFDLGLRKVKAYVKGPGNGRESAIRTVHGAGIEVTEIIDVTPLPHNGCRPPKRRRV